MNISQLPLFLKKPLIIAQTLSVQFLPSRFLIFTMALLQLVWLFSIAATGASTKYGVILILTLFSAVATLVVIFLPTHAIQKLRALTNRLLNSEKRLLLLLCLVALVIGSVYAASQHIWGDEAESMKAANIIATEGIIAAYSKVGWLGQQHPPLFSLIYALTLKLPGPDLLYMRLVSVLFLAGTLCVTYFLGRELYSPEVGFFASIFVLSFPLVVRLSASAQMDIQLTFFFCFALFLFIRLSRKPSYWLACAVGVVIGLGLLTKYIMVLIFLVLFSYFLFIPEFRKLKYLFVVTMVSMSVFAVWLLYAYQTGILSGQIQRIINLTGSYHVVRNFTENIQSPQAVPQQPDTQSESTDIRDRMQNGILRLGLESLFTRIPSSLGVHHVPLIIFGLLYLIKERKRVNLALLLWIGLVSVSLFLTLPDHRYFLPIFPALAIAIARILLRFPDYAERAILLSLLFEAGNLYLFVNWTREAHLFLPPQ